MATTTAGDIVAGALKEINVLAAGETMSAEDGLDGLDALNLLIDQWAAEQLAIYTVSRVTWTITSGVATYSVGVGSAVNMARPGLQEIEAVRFQDTSISPTLEYPLLQLTENGYASIPQKDLPSTQPTSWYYNPTFPSGTLIFWPKPTSATLQGVMYVLAAVSQFSDLSTVLSLPPGYKRMMIKNLALDLSASYGRAASPELQQDAESTLRGVKAANVRQSDLRVDAGSLGDYWSMWSIRTGP